MLYICNSLQRLIYTSHMKQKKFTARYHQKSQTMTDLVRPAIEPICRKRGFVSADIFINWSSIVGQRYAETVQPEKIIWPRNTAGKSNELTTLVVRTDSATSMFLEYEKAQFVERINTFFGWGAINRIKIVNHPLRQKPKPPQLKHRKLQQTEIHQLEAKLSGVSNNRLKSALFCLGKDVFATIKPSNSAKSS